MTDAVISIIDDRELARTDLKDMAEDLTGAESKDSIKIPSTFDDTERLFLFNTLDGFLIDFNLRTWDLSKRLIKRVKGVGPIHDGIDIANLAFKLFKKAKDAIYIYSSEVDLEEPKYVQKLDNLPFVPTVVSKYKTYEEMEEHVKPLFEKAQKVRTANPLFQLPDFVKMSPNHRLHAFKSVYFNSANWVDVHFDAVGDYAWVVVCGHRVEKDYYGSLIGNKWRRGFGIKALTKYFDLTGLKSLARRRKFFPFPFWNLRKPEFIDQQFKRAGPKLVNIPDVWRSFFGVAMARPCARAYVDHGERRILKSCRELDEAGQMELMKVAYKMLIGKTSGMSVFKRDVKQFELPQVVDILEGRVEEINKKESKAVVLLRPLDGGLPFTEVFDLKMLKEAKVEFLAQRFDYTIYQQPFGSISSHVEPVYDEG